MYANDLVVLTDKKEALGVAGHRLGEACKELGLTSNVKKTKWMKFGRGGGRTEWKMYIDGKKVERENRFRYLGVTILPGLGMGAQVEAMAERCAAATAKLKDMRKYSLGTCRRVWRVMLQPIVLYAMGAVGPKLRAGDLKKIDGIKARYWKRCLGLGKNASNTLTMRITAETYATDDLCAVGVNIKGGEIREYLRGREEREKRYRLEGYEDGPAFRGGTGNRWRGDMESARRSAVCRVTAHGLHHRLCIDGGKWHDIGKKCVCKKCGDRIEDRWHILQCIAIGGEDLMERVREVEPGTGRGQRELTGA